MSCNILSFEANNSNFKVFLGECGTDSPYPVDEIDTVEMVFYKDDGSRFTVPANLEEDPDNLGTFFIEYTNKNIEGETILDLRGDGWEFTGLINFITDAGDFEIADKAGFIVV